MLPLWSDLNTTGESSMIWAPASALFASSLVKIPLLFSGTYLAVLAQSPPNPPPQLDELKKYDGVKDTMLPPLIMRRSILVQTVRYVMSGIFNKLLTTYRLSTGATLYANLRSYSPPSDLAHFLLTYSRYSPCIPQGSTTSVSLRFGSLGAR